MLDSWRAEKLDYFSIRYGYCSPEHKSCIANGLGVVLETVFPHQSNEGNLRMLVFKTVIGGFYVLLMLSLRSLNRLLSQLLRRIFLLIHKVF